MRARLRSWGQKARLRSWGQKARLRSWGQSIREHWVAITAVAVLLVGIVLVYAEIRSYGTGFAAKTLWDWLNLLGVLAIPAAVGLGTIWFTSQQAKVSDTKSKDNQREAALQAYIDKMSELLLKEHLGERTADGQLKSEYEQVRKIARVRTLTVLRGLDAIRKVYLLQFLHESGLIDKNKRIIDLSGADLRKVNLSKADLVGADLSKVNLGYASLSEANLSEANLSKIILSHAGLSKANLSRSNLSEANLSKVNLSRADFSEANLKNATGITDGQRKRAKSLKSATMPNGSIHP